MGESTERNLPLTALQQIEAAALQLLQAVRSANNSAFTPHVLSLPVGKSVADLVNEFLLAKARANRSAAYLSLLLKHLRAFSKGRESSPAAAVASSKIESWLYGNDWAAKTRRGHLLTVRALYEFGISRSYFPANPALGVDLPQVDTGAPGIHSPEQVEIVLAKCADVSTLRFLAIRYFAGLRGSEAAALDEKEIGKEFIEVTAAKAKTRRRRLVKIEPNLRAWLDYTAKLGGSLPLRQLNNRLTTAVKASGVEWPKNVTRHSFCSYHLAAFQSASKTALEAGHTEQMLFGHYRELVTPEQGRRYFAILPPA